MTGRAGIERRAGFHRLAMILPTMTRRPSPAAAGLSSRSPWRPFISLDFDLLLAARGAMRILLNHTANLRRRSGAVLSSGRKKSGGIDESIQLWRALAAKSKA